MILFSDAVFAIAITLLVIEIHVPVLGAGGSEDRFLDALIHLAPSFFGYILSFLVIARFWMGHHAALSLTGRFDRALLWPNTMLLMAIAFMPFATAFMAQNLGARVPATLYNVALLITAVASLRVVRIATRASLLGRDVTSHDVAFYRARGTSSIIAAVLAIAFGLVAHPAFSQVPLVTMPLWTWLQMRRLRRVQAADG